MSIEIIPREQQGRGEFDGGTIVETKPIGFPGDGGLLEPYSNLFYWAHAESVTGGFVREHPHRGFEIVSFVLQGSIEHYDSTLQGWLRLEAGDVQVLETGSGITHAERFNPGSAILQIWFDPDLRKSLHKTPSHRHYSADRIPSIERDGIRSKVFAGENGPLAMDSRAAIEEMTLAPGHCLLPLQPNSVHSLYLLEGKLTIGPHKMNPRDLAVVRGLDGVPLEAAQPCCLFSIASPRHVTYPTFRELNV